MLDENAKVYQYIAIGSDITKLKMAAEYKIVLSQILEQGAGECRASGGCDFGPALPASRSARAVDQSAELEFV